MNGGVGSTILLLFGAALVKLGLSDQLLLYVRPVARPWVLVAGVLLVALAGWSLLSMVRRSTDRGAGADGVSARADAPASGFDEGIDHGHVHDGATRTAWLVLAPVVAVLVVAPPALGEFTANRAPVVNAAATGRTAFLQAGAGPVQLSMLTFLLLANDEPSALAVRPVTLIGFVRQRQPTGFTLARLVITCCAADASTAAVTVLTPASVLAPASVPPIGRWVQITGTFAGLGSDADQTPKLTATTVTAIATPRNPYD